MQTCSCPAPAFSGYTLVCTALSGSGRSGMVHRLVSDTTGPRSLLFDILLRPATTATKQRAK